MKILNSAQMRAADEHAIRDLKTPSLSLMERAASCVADIILKRHPHPKSTLILCGKGNNGGDGMATARLLRIAGWDPVLFLLGTADALKADPAENWNSAVSIGVRCAESTNPGDLQPHLDSCEMIVDALFGTGLTKPLEGIYSDAVQRVNRSGKEVIAIDVPSGLSSDTGELLGPVIRATTTVALAALKYCHVLSPACKMCGTTYVVDIGIPVNSTTSVVRSIDVRRVLPHRPSDSHKGTFGHAAIIGGSTGKSGAAYMAGKAALRAGAGLVTILSPDRVQPIIAALGPEIMTLPAKNSGDFFGPESTGLVTSFLSDKKAAAIGPGMGTEEGTMLFFEDLVPRFQGALVIDADGLNLLARNKGILQQRPVRSTVLTPHPGEMARLMQTDTAAVQRDRIGSAQELAEETGAIVVLKGYRTIIAEPDGTVWVNLTGGSSLASGGTGDILTGLITGFLAQKLKPIEAVWAAVYAHGFVANLFEAEFPHQALNALDILNYWNRAIQMIRSGENLEGEYLNVHGLL